MEDINIQRNLHTHPALFRNSDKYTYFTKGSTLHCVLDVFCKTLRQYIQFKDDNV